MATTFTAKTTGTCSACFSRYRAGQKMFTDSTGKVKHVTCASDRIWRGILRDARR